MIESSYVDIMLNTKRIRPIRVTTIAHQVYGTEAVIISPGQAEVRMLNHTATRIWELIDGERSVDDIVAILVSEFEVSSDHARSSVDQLLADLAERDLITWREV